MADQSIKTTVTLILGRRAVLLWFASLFVFVPVAVWLDALILILAFMIAPLLILAAWLAGVPLWALRETLVNLWRRRWLEALLHAAILPIGVAVAFLGLKCGDLIAVMTYGPFLKHEVEAVKAGAPPKHANGIFSSPTMAFKLTGGFLDISDGIAYDDSGQSDQMMPLPPSARSVEWQKNAVDVLNCQGSARHLFGNFYGITVSGFSC